MKCKRIGKIQLFFGENNEIMSKFCLVNIESVVAFLFIEQFLQIQIIRGRSTKMSQRLHHNINFVFGVQLFPIYKFIRKATNVIIENFSESIEQLATMDGDLSQNFISIQFHDIVDHELLGFLFKIT